MLVLCRNRNKGSLLRARYLYDGVAELQGVHELHEGREEEPVVSEKAVPLLAFLFQLCRQGRVETTEPGGKHLCSETKLSSALFQSLTLRLRTHRGGPCHWSKGCPGSSEVLKNERVFRWLGRIQQVQMDYSNRGNSSTLGIWLTHASMIWVAYLLRTRHMLVWG